MSTRTSTTPRASRARTKGKADAAPEAVPETPAVSQSEGDEPVVLTGWLCANPVLRHTHTSGKPVTSLRLGLDGASETTYTTVIVWGRHAENCCRYLRSGRLVECTGRWRERSYEAEDGTRIVRELVASYVKFLPRPEPAAAQTEAEDERAVA